MKTVKKRSKKIVGIGAGLVFVAAVFLGALPAAAGEALEQQVLVDEARITLKDYLADKDMGWLKNHIQDSKGVMIVPSLVKAGFILGGSGGRGIVLVRDPQTGEWSQPAFYTLGGVSFGLQIGAESSQVILLIRTQGGLESLYGSSFKLGGDVTIALGPVGAGAAGKGITADLVSFSRAKGAYAGLSLDGSVIKVNGDWNKAYYGKEARPVDILVKKDVSNPGSAKLRQALAKVGKVK
ncbi:MAG: lipid-binding SYLF domain-containing protein [Deltaproteobacteria bacterium]|nr:lipid-binding SYLF domain-containing protein [Deltaproteobacteria bacterium]